MIISAYSTTSECVKNSQNVILKIKLSLTAVLLNVFFSYTQGDLIKVRDLLEQGASVNVKDHAGWTPLVMAASYSK